MNQLREKQKIQAELFKQKYQRLPHEFNLGTIEDLQDIIGNISVEQDLVSTLLKAVILKLKKRNKLIKIPDSTGGGCAVVLEYKKEAIGSHSDDSKGIRQTKERALEKKNTEK